MRNAFIAATYDSPSYAASWPTPGSDGLHIGTEAAGLPQRRKDPSAWATLMESYLPTHLRHKSQPDLDPNPDHAHVIPINSFHLVLSRARMYAQVDLLSFLGVYQDRWDAVFWLVKAMLEQDPNHITSDETSRQLPGLPWPSIGQSLDAITDSVIATTAPQPRKFSLGQFVSRVDLLDGPYGVELDTNIRRKNLGEIWQTLGTMILQAADRSPEDLSYSTIMSHVFRILARLHRIDAFPSSIYNYAPATDPTVLQRPPTLYLLSRRIMSLLSDLEWGIQWEDEIQKYQKLGYDLPKASIQPKIREFGPELWLDLVLWACVEGGWVTEGAWIVKEMERRKSSRETQWSVIGWQEICAVKEPKLDWTSVLRLQIDKTRLNQVGGIGIATGTDSTVDMGTRTISREVVLALIDGLINTASFHVKGNGSSSVGVQQSIATCKKLLERDHPELDPNFQNAIIVRIMESANADSSKVPQRLLDLRLTKTKSKGSGAGDSVSAQDRDTDDAAAILGLLYRVLHDYACEGNLQASLASFVRIQHLVDDKRGKYIESFAYQLRDQLKQGEDTTDFSSNMDRASTVPPDIPPNTIVAFLDLITRSKFFNLGRWLLLNDDIDGGIIDPELYSNPNIQPALLRFATATADNQLFTKILERLEAPLSEPVLHALLRCQGALGKLDAVEELLEYFQATPGMAWKASDAASVAKIVLQMEHGPPDAQTAGQVAQALAVLQNIVRGKYNSLHDPSQLPDLTETKLSNQLGRIFQTLPGSLSKINTESSDDFRGHASAIVTPNAFNIILETIVELFGSVAGKQLWERWCLEPGSSKLNEVIRKVGASDEQVERVVTPTLYMLRTVLRPILEKRRKTSSFNTGKLPEANSTTEVQSAQSKIAEQTKSLRNRVTNSLTDRNNATPSAVNAEEEKKCSTRDEEEERGVMDWVVRMYRKFGLSEKAINAEIPGFKGIKRVEFLVDE